MKENFRQSMKWLHTWVGLVVTWLLFFIFITGTAGYFYQEITRWMEPERPHFMPLVSKEKMLDISQQYLTQHAENAQRWRIYLPNSRDGNLKVWWQAANKEDGSRGERVTKILHPETGEAAPVRETGGGRALYRMHYRLHYMPTSISYWLVGFCTMVMLLAVITGVVIHKKIFTDFFTFRAKKGLVGWLDIHNVFSVMALPFHFMITYSGLLFFMTTYMFLAFDMSLNDKEKNHFYDDVFPEVAQVEKTGRYQALAPLSTMFKQTKPHWSEDTLVQVEIKRPLDSSSQVRFRRWETDITYNPDDEIYFTATGELQRVAEKAVTLTGQIDDGFISLHEGQFASPIARWLYLLFGLVGAAMVASGSILWISKRKPKQDKRQSGPDFGYRLVETLNIGTIVGLPIAIAAYFFANRLLPLDMLNRAAWELNSLFICWALLLIYPIFRPAMSAWLEQLKLAAFVFTFIPFLNFLTTDKHLGVTLLQRDWNLAGFDLFMLVTGLTFAFAAYKVKQHQRATKSARSSYSAKVIARPVMQSKEVSQ